MTKSTFSNDCYPVFASLPCYPVDDFDREVDIVLTIFFVLMLLAITFGLMGNLLVVYIVCMKPQMLTVHNVHVANLAVIDVIFLLVCGVVHEVEIGSIVYRDDVLILSVGLSATITFIKAMCFTALCGTLMVLAVERYLAIVRPLENKKRRTLKNAAILQTGVWTASVTIATIATIIEVHCTSHKTAEAYFLYAVVFFFISLIVFILGCYAAIFNSVREHEKVEGDRVARWQHRRNLQRLRMMNALVITFLLCRGLWIGYAFYAHYAFRTADGGDIGRPVYVIIPIFASFMCTLNSAGNPIIYGAFTSDVRKHMVQVVFHPFETSAPQRRGTWESTRQSTVTVSSITKSSE